MVPLLKNPSIEWKKAAFSQFPRRSHMGYSVRCGPWRYTEWLDKNGTIIDRELYDHSNGPLADKNLASDPEYRKTVEKLSAILDKGNGWKSLQK
jgi:iduronate 2-sulfatase